MSNFLWKILHVDISTRCMVVEYTKNGISLSLNIPIPSSNAEIITTVNQYAPVTEWEKSKTPMANVIVGMSGTGVDATVKPTIDRLKENAKGKINLIRDIIIDYGVEYKGYRFDSTESTVNRLTAIVTSIQAGYPLPEDFAWRTVDNVMVPLTADDLIKLLNIITSNISSTFIVSWEKKNQIDKAITEEEISSVTWEHVANKVIL